MSGRSASRMIVSGWRSGAHWSARVPLYTSTTAYGFSPSAAATKRCGAVAIRMTGRVTVLVAMASVVASLHQSRRALPTGARDVTRCRVIRYGDPPRRGSTSGRTIVRREGIRPAPTRVAGRASPGGVAPSRRFARCGPSRAGLGARRLLDVSGYYDSLAVFLAHSLAEGFLKPAHRAMLMLERSPERLVDRLARYEPPTEGKWA